MSRVWWRVLLFDPLLSNQLILLSDTFGAMEQHPGSSVTQQRPAAAHHAQHDRGSPEDWRGHHLPRAGQRLR